MQLSTDEMIAVLLVRKMLTQAATPVPEFLDWMADRLIHVYKENEFVDYVHCLRDRANQLREISKLLSVHRNSING